MENEIMNNEVMEETIATPCEVVETNNEASNSAPVYIPVQQAYEPESKGPNKLLIAGAVIGAAVVAKKVTNAVKKKAADKKEQKAKEEEERILAVLKKAGLITEPAKVEATAEAVVDVKAEEVVPETETKPEEKKEETKK